MCADVGTLVYHLRLNRDRISSTLFAKHDFALRASLDSILGGGVTSEAWELATLGVTASGLGLKEADAIALPAFVASRLASRPHVQALAAHMEEAETGTVKQIMENMTPGPPRHYLRSSAFLTARLARNLLRILRMQLQRLKINGGRFSQMPTKEPSSPARLYPTHPSGRDLVTPCFQTTKTKTKRILSIL